MAAAVGTPADSSDLEKEDIMDGAAAAPADGGGDGGLLFDTSSSSSSSSNDEDEGDTAGDQSGRRRGRSSVTWLEEELSLSPCHRRSQRLKEQQQQQHRMQARWRSQLLAAAAADLAEAAAETQAPSSIARINQFMHVDMQLLCCTEARDTHALKSVCRTGNSIAGLVKANAVHLNKEKEEQQLGLLLSKWKTLEAEKEEEEERGECEAEGDTATSAAAAERRRGLNFATLSKRLPYSFASSLSFSYPSPLLGMLWRGDFELEQPRQRRRGRLQATQQGAAAESSSTIQIVDEPPQEENRAAEMLAIKNEILRVLVCIYKRDQARSCMTAPASASTPAATAGRTSSPPRAAVVPCSASAAVSACDAAAATPASTRTKRRRRTTCRGTEEGTSEKEGEERDESGQGHTDSEGRSNSKMRRLEDPSFVEEKQNSPAADNWRVCTQKQQWGAVDLWQLVIDPRGVEGFNQTCLHLFALTMLISENKISLSAEPHTLPGGEQVLSYVVRAVMEEQENRRPSRLSRRHSGGTEAMRPRVSRSTQPPRARTDTPYLPGTDGQTGQTENGQAILCWSYSLWKSLREAMGMTDDSTPLLDTSALIKRLQAGGATT